MPCARTLITKPNICNPFQSVHESFGLHRPFASGAVWESPWGGALLIGSQIELVSEKTESG